MLEIPGFRYDASIKNYVPIVLDTPANRAFNLVTASNIIKYEAINSLQNQIKLSQININFQRNIYHPYLQGSSINLYNISKYQQLGKCDIKKLLNFKRLEFLQTINAEISNDDELNSYHNIYRCFPPESNSQWIMSSYSSSPYHTHHSLLKIDYTDCRNNSFKLRSNLVKRFDNLTELKLSVDNKNVVLLNKKEFHIIDKNNQTEVVMKLNRDLHSEMRYPFDVSSDKFVIGMNSKKGMTHLAVYNLSSNDAGYETRKCDWQRKWVFRDVVYDINGSNLFLLLRGRMNNSSECILQQDWRCPIPTQKNIRRLSLNFHQNSSVYLTRVPNYSDLIITHCYDGRCALWDMRWKNRPAVTYSDISPGKPDLPINIDPSGQFVTMTDSNNILRVFNLKTGLTLFSDQQKDFDPSNNHIYSFYSHTGFHFRPTLLSNFSPNCVQIRKLNF